MSDKVHALGSDDFTIEMFTPPLSSKWTPSVDTVQQMPILSLDERGWTVLEIKRGAAPILYVHGETETIEGTEFNVVSVYDKETMKLRQRILTRSDLLKG